MIETDPDEFLSKLRVCGFGTSALVATFIVASLAEALGLRFPCLVPISIDAEISSGEREDGLLDFLAACSVLN